MTLLSQLADSTTLLVAELRRPACAETLAGSPGRAHHLQFSRVASRRWGLGPRPRSTTWPGRPGAAGRRCTGCSPGARTHSWSRPWPGPRWPGWPAPSCTGWTKPPPWRTSSPPAWPKGRAEVAATPTLAFLLAHEPGDRRVPGWRFRVRRSCWPSLPLSSPRGWAGSSTRKRPAERENGPRGSCLPFCVCPTGRRPNRRRFGPFVRHHLHAPGPAPGPDRRIIMAIDLRSDRHHHQPRGPGAHQHRRRRGDPRGQGRVRHHFHVGLRKGRPAQAEPAVREGQDVDVECPDRPPVGHAGRSGGPPDGQDGRGRRFRPRGRPVEDGLCPLARCGMDPLRHREPELDAVAVHAWGTGRLDLYLPHRRERALDRRQVLRRNPGDGRGAPPRGVLPVPGHQAVGPLPDQRPPPGVARRHHLRQPLGT